MSVQLDNYKFTFDIITRDIKSIQNLETGEFIKTSLEQIEIKIKISLKFLILKAIQIENIYIAFSKIEYNLTIPENIKKLGRIQYENI